MSDIRLLVLCCAWTSKDDRLSKRSNMIIFIRALSEQLINIKLENVLYKIKRSETTELDISCSDISCAVRCVFYRQVMAN